MQVLRKERFEPDWRHLRAVVENRRPGRLPLYEHHIDREFMEKATGRSYAVAGGGRAELVAHYRAVAEFWLEMGYDGFDYEASVCDTFPGHGAILGGEGPIQTRADFAAYPFGELEERFWARYRSHLEAIREAVPAGMKPYGGCGYGIFEASQDLVGFESLCVMQHEDPELFGDLYRKIGDLYAALWGRMVREYGDLFVFFRMGDDLGYKTATMLSPDTIRAHILPQYRRIIGLVHGAGQRFLLHSCGCIFAVMEDLIACGIDAKHSNEDQIAPFERWIGLYGDRIGLFGGIDVDTLCRRRPEEVYAEVLEKGTRFRAQARGYGLGSGNSIPGYVAVDGYMAMVEAAREIRRRERAAAGGGIP